MIAEMKMTAMQQFLHLLRLAGLALIWLAIPTFGGCPATLADRDHLKPFRLIDNSRLMNTMKSESGVLYEKFIAFQKNGEHFIYASTPPEGSGAFMAEAIFGDCAGSHPSLVVANSFATSKRLKSLLQT